MDQNQQNGFFNPNEAPNNDLNQQYNAEVNQVSQPQQFDQAQQIPQTQQAQFNQPQQQFDTYQQANGQQFGQAPQQNPYQQPQFQEYQAPVYSTNFQPIKKKFNPLAIIIPAVILVAAAVVLFFIFFNKSSYEKAEKQFFSDLRSTVLSSANEAEEQINDKPQSVSFDVTLPNELSYYLGGISKVGFNSDAIIDDEKLYSKSSVYLEDAKIDLECWADVTNKLVYMLFPEASDICLKIDVSENLENASQNVKIKSVDYDKLAEELCNVLDETMKTYYEEIGDVSTEKNQEFTVEAETFTADKAVVHLNAAQLAKIVSAFRDNLLANEEALSLLADVCDVESVDVLKENISSAIDKAKLDSIIAGEACNAAFDMTVYMKGNNIVGRDITITNDDLEKVTVQFYDLPADNDEEVVYLNVITDENDDSENVKLYFKNKENNNAESGAGYVDAFGTKLNVSYNDVAVTDDLFQGTVTVSMEGEAAFTANMEFKEEGEAKIITLKIPNICSITAAVKPSDITFKDYPSGNMAEISANGSFDYDDEMFQQFSDDLSEYIQEILEPIMSGFYGSDYGDLPYAA